VSLIQLINFDVKGDERGLLVALESNSNVPFDIKRVYYVFDTKGGVVRGCHAHKEIKQVAVCVHGHCRMLMDDGISKADVVLDSPELGIFIDRLQWHEMHDFSEDCVLLVLASDYYHESDYIREYDDFIKRVNSHVHP